MSWHTATYFALLIFTALLAASILAYAWRQRGMAGRVPFLVLCVLAMAWPLGTVGELLAPSFHAKALWDDFLYTAFVPLPFTFLALTLQYLGYDRWLARWRLAALLFIPIVTILFAWTNRYHGLIQHHLYLDTSGVLPVIGKTFGPVYWVHFAYSYLVFVIIVVLLWRAWSRAQPFYRGQPLILLAGLLIPLGGSLSYTLHISPAPGIDLTPMLLSVSGMLVSWGLFRYRLFDLVPVARERVIESMSDGAIVLDALRRVVDMNPAAERLLGLKMARAAGRPASFVLRDWPELFAQALLEEAGSSEITRRIGNTETHYELHRTPVLDRQHRAIGRMLLLHDITKRKQAEAEVLFLAYHDSLTGLPNRQMFQERLAQELARAARKGDLVAVMMMDLDGFKAVNDTWGHEAGDAALCEVARRLKGICRESDVVSRIGGDEFTLLLTDISSPLDASALAERVIQAMADPVIVEGQPCLLTPSIGISLFPLLGAGPTELLRQADTAMYLAKNHGRNRYRVYSAEEHAATTL